MRIIALLIALCFISPLTSAPIEFNPPMKVLSWTPRIFLIEHFLTDEECDHLIEKGKPYLERSTVVAPDLFNSVLHEGRTSEGMFFSKGESDLVISSIENRIAELTLLPQKNGEEIQLLHYNVGGEYKPHFDWFNRANEGEKFCLNRGGQRLATLIVYLHTTKEGGETIFPKVNIKVKPVKGNAILFYNCLPNGKEDPLSFHGGAPVIAGEKWIMTKWIREREFN